MVFLDALFEHLGGSLYERVMARQQERIAECRQQAAIRKVACFTGCSRRALCQMVAADQELATCSSDRCSGYWSNTCPASSAPLGGRPVRAAR